MDNVIINVSKLHEELSAAGLPVISVHSDGRVEYSRSLSSADQSKASEIIKNHDPEQIPVPTIDQMVRALWKKVMLDDPKEADELNKLL